MNKLFFLLFLFSVMITSCDNGDDTIEPITGRLLEIKGSQYDENRYFFLGHFFRENYERWLEEIPLITSGVNIHRLEVYVLSRNNEDNNIRSIVALMDLGEATRIHSPDVTANGNLLVNNLNLAWNGANDLFSKLTEYDENLVEADLLAKLPSFESSTDYVRLTTARKLDDTEFTVNQELGYIRLLRRLQSDEVLAVSYQYSYNGELFQVGEIESDYFNRNDDEVIYLKMLRPNNIATELNTWDLMMKNAYNLNATQVSEEGFQLNIVYRNDITGQDVVSLPEGQLLKDVLLLEALKLDQLN
ncbi:MAG: cell surface protein SprA, partial [Bacteroidota bacterium]